MSDGTGGGQANGRPMRVLEVRLTYREEGSDVDRTLTISDPSGNRIDGVIWSGASFGKVVQAPGGGPPAMGPLPEGVTIRRPRGDMETMDGNGDPGPGGPDDCVWVHATDCTWTKSCG